jgi:hypothetical protein
MQLATFDASRLRAFLDDEPVLQMWWRAAGKPNATWRIDRNPAHALELDRSIRQVDPHAVAVAIGTLPPAPMNRREVVNQHWLRVGGRSTSTFVALPIHPPSRAQVRVLIRRDDGDAVESSERAPRYHVAANTGNAAAHMLLGYLSAGAYGPARRVGANIVDTAERMLQEKRDDPVSAAIAGYYLLVAGELNRLHDWTRNLADWFPWLPDGAVIHAWHLIRDTKPDLRGARQRLLQAEARGLPVVTFGLRLLFDGLDFFARRAPRDGVVVAARDRVQRYARAAEWRALTTSFYASHPSRPGERE